LRKVGYSGRLVDRPQMKGKMKKVVQERNKWGRGGKTRTPTITTKEAQEKDELNDEKAKDSPSATKGMILKR